MSEKWTRASLRVAASSFRPDVVTQTLGLEPSRVAHNPSGAWIWILDSGLPSSTPAEAQIRAILELIRSGIDSLRGLEAVREVFLGFAAENGQGGMTITAPLLAELAASEIDLVLDLYPPESSAPDTSTG